MCFWSAQRLPFLRILDEAGVVPALLTTPLRSRLGIGRFGMRRLRAATVREWLDRLLSNLLRGEPNISKRILNDGHAAAIGLIGGRRN
jgi:hypothetical protein